MNDDPVAAGAGVRRIPRFLITGMVIALAAPLVIFVAIGLYLDDSTTPVDTEAAVAGFRSDTTPTPAVPTAAPAVLETLRTAPSGVYVYETIGGESIDALGGADHDYPAESTITVRATDCGATYQWIAIEERRETLDICVIDGALALRSYVADHEFFGQGDNKPLVCDVPVVLLTSDPGLDETTGVCRGAGLVEELTVVVGPPEDKAVGDVDVEVIPIQIDVVVGPLDGHTQGASTTLLAIDPRTGVIVEWSDTTTTTADSQVGSVDYAETFTLRLVSLAPRT